MGGKPLKRASYPHGLQNLATLIDIGCNPLQAFDKKYAIYCNPSMQYFATR